MVKKFHIQSIFDDMIDDVKYIQRNYLLRKNNK